MSSLNLNDDIHTTEDLNKQEDQKGVSSIVFTIVICTIFLFITGCTIYINLMDKLNANDAYRNTEQRRQAEEYKTICVENYNSVEMLTEWLRQQNLKPPTEFTKKRVCVVSVGVEERMQHKTGENK